MPVKLVVAVTDRDWFEHLRSRPEITEVNFWSPGTASFRALEPGELFFFKLHAPHNYIAGFGIFAHANTLPCSLAWEAFGDANGANTLEEMRARIARYRRVEPGDRSDFTIGCRVLAPAFFFDESDWLETPQDWARNIVSFKTYTADEPDGLRLWEAAQQYLQGAPLESSPYRQASEPPAPPFIVPSQIPVGGWGEPTLIRPRLGQGAFRILVTDNYRRRCAVTGERTLPALEAAHIRPFAAHGQHDPRNGLLLRRDLHSLFDRGYVTVTPAHNFEVSRRIRDEFENGRDYYALHGRLIRLPEAEHQHPDPAALSWHNDNRFLG
ncbi:MAG: HNH endonuclease [Stellaceae bacterium]